MARLAFEERDYGNEINITYTIDKMERIFMQVGNYVEPSIAANGKKRITVDADTEEEAIKSFIDIMASHFPETNYDDWYKVTK